jgi:hypothetical protein
MTSSSRAKGSRRQRGVLCCVHGVAKGPEWVIWQCMWYVVAAEQLAVAGSWQ